jgi:hypothetical protein
MERLCRHAAGLLRERVPVVLAGDYNVVPTDFDIYRTTSYKDDALLQPKPRALFRRILEQGWTDPVRKLHPDQPMFSFWDYMRNRWPRDAGLRIDFLLLSPVLAKRLEAAGVDRAVRGKPNASDHAPVWITLKDKPSRPRSAKASTPRRRPLLVVDGDSFAHRSYHALPKNIMRAGDRPAGAILGFANALLRFYRAEQPRAVLVAWDTYEAPTYRHKAFPAYQSGREFDAASRAGGGRGKGHVVTRSRLRSGPATVITVEGSLGSASGDRRDGTVSDGTSPARRGPSLGQ